MNQPVLDTAKIQFAPDQRAHVHEEGAIKLICSQFRSHEDGLPEWVKNSSDQYARQDAKPDASIVVVLLKDAGRSGSSAVGCLDFGGMSVNDIEDKFRKWADPQAAGTESGVEGGHGNGGKCYMTQLFASHAYVHTVRNGRGNKYGFKDGKAIAGYFPSTEAGRNFAVSNLDQELANALAPFGVKLENLPAPALAAWRERKSFTLVAGFNARYLNNNRIPAAKWKDSLSGHQQMIRALGRNRIYIIHNATPLDGAWPMTLPEILPIPGAEVGRLIPVPDVLIDPESDQEIATGAIAGKSRLELRTSNISMRWSLKARHTVNGWTDDGKSTGFWEVPALSRATYATKIYGDLHLHGLRDYKQNDRRNHSPGPLVRAIGRWLTEQIDTYSKDFEKQDRLQASKEEQDELSRLNDLLNKWKNNFLEQEFGGVSGGDREGVGSDRTYRPRPPKGPVAQVVLSISHTLAGRGVTFEPSIKFLGVDGKPVRSVPFTIETSDARAVDVDNELYKVTTRAPGRALLTVVCLDSRLRSNSVEIEVLDISKIEMNPPELEVRVGGRQRLSATVVTADGRTLTGVYLIWTESNPQVVQISPGGMVFGREVGTSEVTAGDDAVEAVARATIKVIEADEEEGNSGSGFPRILLSEIDHDPLAEDGSSTRFNSEDPPVMQRPADVNANIWWINMAAPLARRYIDTAKGGGAHSKEWRVYLLERYIEIMVKILLTYDFNQGEELTFETMMRRWDEQSSAVQKRAMETLGVFLDGGDVEEAA